MKKYRKRILIVIFIVMLIVYLYLLVPGTKRFFPCYMLFRATADNEVYLEKLPSTAYDVEYYVYEKFFLDKSGYRMKVSPEEYEQAKQTLYNKYNNEYITATYSYDGISKKMLSSEEMKNMHVEFLEELLTDDSSENQYYILTVDRCEPPRIDLFSGVICNDESCEIIQFTYYQLTDW